jgi:hypothetical protein
LPWHPTATIDRPMSAPQTPATMMAAKAATRALTDGSADAGRGSTRRS